MPFKPTGKRNKKGQKMFKSPSGKKFTWDQVKLYYAGGGKFPGQKKG